ncbi:DUF2846 domain-containing protein [Halomonas sediminis]
MKVVLALLAAVSLAGCSMTPYQDLNLDTTSNFRKPSNTMAGVYVYQWKTGVLGAMLDVDFEIKDGPTVSLNTGEYGYFEIEPGQYEYKYKGGLWKMHAPIEFQANQNYFFRAAFANLSDHAFLVRSQQEINEAKQNIHSGRYEWHEDD